MPFQPCHQSVRPQMLSSLSLQDILRGHTQRPISAQDLRQWLSFQIKSTSAHGQNAEAGLAALDFLTACDDYESRFASLSQEKQKLAPPPFQAISQAVSQNPHLVRSPRSPPRPATDVTTSFLPSLSSMPSQTSWRTHSTIPSIDQFRLPSAPTAVHQTTRARRSTDGDITRPWGMPRSSPIERLKVYQRLSSDALALSRAVGEDQPLRLSFDVLLQRFIAFNGPRTLRHLILPKVLIRLESESELTNHPEVLNPAMTCVEEWFSINVLPAFLLDRKRNLHRHTARGRLLIGTLTDIVAIVALILLLLDPSPFRHHGPAIERPFRLLLLPVLTGGIGYGMGARAGLCFWLALFGVRETAEDEYTPAVDEITQSPEEDDIKTPLISKSQAWQPNADAVCPTVDLTPRHAVDHATSGLITPAWVTLLRLTGIARRVVRVHDPTLRKHQRKAAWAIAAGLTLVLAVTGVILWFLPWIIVS